MKPPLRLLQILFIAALTLQSCAAVKPWEKEYLAKSSMALEPDSLEARFKRHVFESKEGSSGGYSAGGGGCGCN